MGTKQAEIAALSAQLDTLVAQVTALNAQIADKEREIIALQARVAPLLAQLDALNGEISATEAQLKELQAQLTVLDQKVTDANTTLANLQAKKGTNKDAIAAQKKSWPGCRTSLAVSRTRSGPSTDRSPWVAASPDSLTVPGTDDPAHRRDRPQRPVPCRVDGGGARRVLPSGPATWAAPQLRQK